MKTIRQEVQAFVQATETVLSPVMLGEELNEDECDMIVLCVRDLEEKYPVSMAKPRLQSKVPASVSTNGKA